MPIPHSVEEITLQNGARGLLIDVPNTTTVYYSIHFLAGINYVSDTTKSQTAHVMEHLAFGANSKFPTPEAFSQEFTKNGAWNNAFTSNVEMNYYSVAPHMEWERILDLQLLSIAQPRYTQKSLDAEKGNVREELAGNASNHSRILWQETMRAFGLTRWYDPKEIKTIAPITLDDIHEHFSRTHTTKNMKFLVAGNLGAHRDTIIDKLNSLQLEPGERFTIPAETATAPGPVFIVRKDVPSLIFSLTFMINREVSLDELRNMGVLAHILTGTFHSRIFGEARRRGICYGLGTNYETHVSGVTEFSIGGQVQFENAAELCELIIEQLNKVKNEGVTEEELQAAKEYRLGGMQMTNDTVRSLANWYMDEYYDSNIIDRPEEMIARIGKTSVADIKKILNELLDAAVWTFSGIGNSTEAEFTKLYEMFETNLVGKE